MYIQTVSINLVKGVSLTAIPIKQQPTSITSVAYSHFVSSYWFISFLFDQLDLFFHPQSLQDLRKHKMSHIGHLW